MGDLDHWGPSYELIAVGLMRTLPRQPGLQSGLRVPKVPIAGEAARDGEATRLCST